MTTRKIEFVKEHSSVTGAWQVLCDACPVIPHLDALGMKRRACMAGITTTEKGCVSMDHCEHYERFSFSNTFATIKCAKP